MKNGRMQSVDFDKISQWTTVDEEVMYSAENSQEVLQAQKDELDKWKEYQVYEEVEDAGQDAITTKWVVTEKKQDGVSGVKAQLVARGFEEDTTKVRTDSPTISKENLRLICTIAVNNGWKLHSIDVKAAFLQGFPIDRDVYLVPHVEANTGKLWKLKTAVYGLVDASRAWYLTVTDELTSQGAKCSIYDNALFYWRNCGKLEGIVCCHVDDFLFSGSQLFHDKVICHLRNQFSLGNERDSSMIYTGIEMLQSDHEIIMHQTNYINSIKPLNIENISPNRKLVLSEVRNLKALIGQLQWAAKLTRPDIPFATCDLSTRVKQATAADVRLANKQLRKLQDQCSKICIPDIGNICHASLIVFFDASHANLQHGESQGGFIVFLQGENGKSSPLTWTSHKLKGVVKSAMAAEILSLQQASEHAMLLQALINELYAFDKSLTPIVCVIDIKQLHESLFSTKVVEDKRLHIDICGLRQSLERKGIHDAKRVASVNQLADCLTKGTASADRLMRVLAGSEPLPAF